MLFSGVDPGFPVGWGANPQGVGRQHTNLPDFPKNCMELRKVWSVRGAHAGGAPLGSATDFVHRHGKCISKILKTLRYMWTRLLHGLSLYVTLPDQIWLIHWFICNGIGVQSCQSMALRNNGLWPFSFPGSSTVSVCLSVCLSVSPVCFLTLTAQCISLGIVLQVAGISFHFVPGSSVASVGTTFCLKYAHIK